MLNWKVLSVAVIALPLAACQGQGGKQTAGTLLGAAAGGAIGSQIGSGSGRLIAIGTGILIGGLIGNQIGRNMDQQDRAYAARNAQNTLENGRSGTTSNWRNPDNGHRGQFTPQPAYQNAQGYDCREGTQEVWIDGRRQIVTETYCRDPQSGAWRRSRA